MKMAIDWAEIPTDLVIYIAEQLDSMEDFVRFSVVCKSWLLAALTVPKKKTPLPRKFPWLMLAQADESDEYNGSTTSKISTHVLPTRCFFNLGTKNVYELKVPETYGRVCFGVHYGWLFTLGKHDLQISLLHPFSRDQISLPPFMAFSDRDDYTLRHPHSMVDIFIRKVALSTNPGLNQKDCVVVAIYGTFAILGFARPGDERWTNIQVHSKCYEDVVFYNGKFYAVDCHGVVVVCDIDGDQGPKSEVIAPPPEGNKAWFQKYLVESSGDLLLVSQVRGGQLFEESEEGPRYFTRSFSVFKMERNNSVDREDEYPFYWVPVDNLGDRALFIGKSTSVSLSASDYYNGCIQPNSIYFTDGNPELYFGEEDGGGRDMGIFNLEDGTIQLLYHEPSMSKLSPPLWIN